MIVGVRGGRAGGLAMMWRADVELELSSWSQNHISMVRKQRGKDGVVFTGFYGNPNQRRRDESWNLLRSLKVEVNHFNWVCFGNFNAI